MLHTIPLGIVSSTAAAYLLEQSLLFNPADSAYLSRTPSSTGDVKTWTFSAWVKFASGTNYNMLMGHRRDGGGASTQTQVTRSSSGALMFFNSLSGSIDANLSTEALFRDTSAWYHIVYIVNTTESTDTDRVKIIVNGVQQTIAAGADWPALNATTRFNEASRFMYVGALNDAANNPYLFHGGLMAEVHFVDGTAVAATNFGEEDDDGFWNPIEYTEGSYGTNGFQLKFADTSAFGDDTSGNTNDYTSNNFTAADQLEDTPTDSSGDGIGNFATWNPNNGGGHTVGVPSEGNLQFTNTASNYKGLVSTIAFPTSGKWGVKFTITGSVSGSNDGDICIVRDQFGSPTAARNRFIATTAANYTTFGLHMNGGDIKYKFNGGSSVVHYNGASSATSDVYEFLFDADNGYFDVKKNGSAFGTQLTGIPTGELYWLCADMYATGILVDFGQQGYVPSESGYSALATQNLPAPTIADGSQYFNTVLYTGNGTAIGSGGNAITGVGFQPDFVWIKDRGNVVSHVAFDSVRGTNGQLYPDLTNAEATGSIQTLDSFDADGFTLGSASAVNGNTYNFVAWCWKAGGAASSNTDGSITTSVSANTTSGFSIVSYTGTGSNGTIGHGLGVTPSFYIVKNRDTGSASWICYHTSLGATKGIKLEESGTPSTNPLFFNNTEPTSSVFTVGTHGDTNTNTDNYIAYCWSEVEGFSKFGSYTGNGNADGPFVYTGGFTPAFVMTKRTNSSGDWRMHDTTRVPYNPFDGYLRASTTNAELSGGDFDFLSNGFKIRNNGGEINASGGAFIYMAFAEHPFQGAGGVTQARAR